MQSDDLPKNNSIYMFLFGNLDDTYVEKLHRQLESLFSENFDEVVFNFSNVTAFTKAAVDDFLEFYHNATAVGKSIRIEGINDYVAELFKSLELGIPFAL